MFKKIALSMSVVTALGLGLGNAPSEASQWNDSSIKQSKSSSGWERMNEEQIKRIDKNANIYKGSAASVQGQSVYVNGFQLQNGFSDGPARASQLSNISINMGDVQTNGTTELQQKTEGMISSEQSVEMLKSGYLLQSQSHGVASFHFQGSIEGGPTIQNQISQAHSYKFSSAVSKAKDY